MRHYHLGKCSHNQRNKSGTSDKHDLPKSSSYRFKFNSFITTTYYYTIYSVFQKI